MPDTLSSTYKNKFIISLSKRVVSLMEHDSSQTEEWNRNLTEELENQTKKLKMNSGSIKSNQSVTRVKSNISMKSNKSATRAKSNNSNRSTGMKLVFSKIMDHRKTVVKDSKNQSRAMSLQVDRKGRCDEGDLEETLNALTHSETTS